VVCGPLIGWAELVDEVTITSCSTSRRPRSTTRNLAPGPAPSEASWVPLIGEVCDRDVPDGLAEFLAEHRIIPTIV
jgi:hypothetical protein